MGDVKLYIFDADSTLRRCTVSGQPCPNQNNEWELLPNVKEKLRQIYWGPGGAKMGIASNQGGIALGYLTERAASQMLKDLFIELTGRYPVEGLIQFCPHLPDAHCYCRKPLPGMLLNIMHAADVWDVAQILFVGDQDIDRAAAYFASVRFQWAGDFFGWDWEKPSTFTCSWCLEQDSTQTATYEGEPAGYDYATGLPICADCYIEQRDELLSAEDSIIEFDPPAAY